MLEYGEALPNTEEVLPNCGTEDEARGMEMPDETKGEVLARYIGPPDDGPAAMGRPNPPPMGLLIPPLIPGPIPPPIPPPIDAMGRRAGEPYDPPRGPPEVGGIGITPPPASVGDMGIARTVDRP